MKPIDISTRPRIYLAGPMIFEADPERYFTPMKAICAEAGLEGVTPLDNQVHLEGIASGDDLNLAIYRADENLMRTLDGAILCLDPFRGSTEMDPGTAYEAGYLKALGKPMTGWTQDSAPYPDKVRAFSQAVWGADLSDVAVAKAGANSGMLRDRDGVMVHSDGCVQNLMIEMGIRDNGGAVFADADWQVAFRLAAEALAARFVKKAA